MKSFNQIMDTLYDIVDLSEYILDYSPKTHTNLDQAYHIIKSAQEEVNGAYLNNQQMLDDLRKSVNQAETDPSITNSQYDTIITYWNTAWENNDYLESIDKSLTELLKSLESIQTILS